MVRSAIGARAARHGGTLGLACLIGEHGEAIEYDLLAIAGRTLDDLGGSLSDRALLAFVRHVPEASALRRELRREPPEDAAWREAGLTAQLLAAVFDALNMQTWVIAQTHSRRSIRNAMPRPMDRPGARSGDRHFGRDPIPAAEFDAWWSREPDGGEVGEDGEH